MKRKKSQLEWVRKCLLETGKISRNYCLQNYISRLSHYIFVLHKEGWDIEGNFVKTANGKDFVYSLKTRPTKTVSQVNIINGVAVERRVQVPV